LTFPQYTYGDPKDIKLLEGVQRRAIKLIKVMENFICSRLDEFGDM